MTDCMVVSSCCCCDEDCNESEFQNENYIETFDYNQFFSVLLASSPRLPWGLLSRYWDLYLGTVHTLVGLLLLMTLRRDDHMR